MLLVAKLVLILGLMSLLPSAQARTLRVLIVGEGVAANCNVKRFSAVSGVYELGPDGRENPAHDPFEWSECKAGSVWIPLGEKLIKAGLAEKVVFMPVTAERARASSWLTNGPARNSLTAALNVLSKNSLTVDYALFQPGCSDKATPSPDYLNNLRMMVKSTSLAVRIDRWILAQSPDCPREDGERLRSLQRQIGRNPVFNTFIGPDLSKVGDSFRDERGYLKAEGQTMLAELWATAILNARAASEKYQRESLLYFFK
jgi:hypothetical protein